MSDAEAGRDLPPRRPLGIPVAWWIAVGTTFGVCFGASAFVAAVFGQLVRPISSELGWTRTQTTGALTLATLLTIAGAPIAGYCIDRFGARRVLLFAALTLPLAVGSLSAVHGNLSQYYATMALIAILGAGCLPGTYTAIILKWFDRRRGLGLGFPLAGVGMANILLPPAIRGLIGAYGWHVAIATVAAAMFAVVVPMALLLFRLAPRTHREIDGGMAPPTREAAAAAPQSDALDWKQAIRTRRYLQLAAAFVLLGIATLAVVINFQAMLEDEGVPALTVAKLLSLQGFFMLGFRLASGWLLDRFPPRQIAALVIVAPAIGIAIMVGSHAVPLLAFAMALLAVGFGGEFNVMSFFASRYSDRASYGKLYGMIYSAYVVGGSIGPLLLAQVYDRTHSYQAGLLSLAALIVVAAGLIVTLPRLAIEGGWKSRAGIVAQAG